MAAESAAPGPFTRHLWQTIAPIYAAILAHPFIQGLTDGSLPEETFRFYAVQDALYLRDFARALSLAAAKAPDEDWIITFNQHAAGALQVERALHESFFREFGLSEQQVRATPLAPTNLAYTSYLLAVAYGCPIHEAVAALLPCYWIYWEVGKTLQRRGLAAPALPALDRDLRRRRVRRAGRRRTGAGRRPRRAATARGPRSDDPPLRHHQPLRMALLEHGLPPRAVAGVISRR